jgi:hemolysin III
MVVLERPQSMGEEIANSLSHGVGFVAAVAAAPVLILTTAQHGRPLNVVGAAIFAVTVVLLYCASTVYHAVPHDRAKALLRKLDHGAIYLLIAGTYTPFTLGALNGPLGWTLLGVVWSLAAVGVALKAFDRIEHPLASLGLYLLMGWLCVIALELLLERVPTPGLLLLGAGGFAYMAGVAFFATDHRIRYGHFIWHLFVLAGTGCHFFAVLGYAA